MGSGDQQDDKSALRALVEFLSQRSFRVFGRWGLRLRRWVWCSILFFLALAAIGAFNYFSAPVATPPPLRRAKITVTPASGSKVSDLTISVAPPPARSERSAVLQINAWVVNNTGQKGTLTARLIPVNRCEQQRGSSTVTLDAAGSGSVVATIDARNCLGTHQAVSMPVEVQYWWQASAGVANPKQAASVQFAEDISTSPILFVKNAEENGWPRLRGAVRAIYTVLKDLIWPVVLALLAFILQEIQRNRDASAEKIAADQQKAETDRSRDRELEMTRRAERLEMLTHLLPEYISLVQDHYLPIARRMQTVNQEWTEFKKQWLAADSTLPAELTEIPREPDKNAYTQLLTSILLMRRRQQSLNNSKGGIFFRSSIGEEIFADCISEFFRKCHEFFNGDRNAFESLALQLKPDATLPDSIHVLFPSSPASEKKEAQAEEPTQAEILKILQDFQKKISPTPGKKFEFERYINLVRLCEQILSFEGDRTFYQTQPDPEKESSGWYFDAPVFEITDEMLNIPDGENKDADSGKYSEMKIHGLVLEYLNGVPAACRPKRDFTKGSKALQEYQELLAATAKKNLPQKDNAAQSGTEAATG
jgi:hypothetical protein